MPSRIDDLLQMAMSFGASDLHLRAGSFPVIRVNGELRPLSGVARLTQDETLEMAFSMMSNRQKQHFKEAFEVDIGYGVSGLGRFRVNIFQQRNSIGIVARVISDEIKNFSELGLPPILTKIADENRGLILITGTTGSGKSTTLAAIVDHINQTRNSHIVTIEDPIEFLHKDKNAFITQREVDVDTRSFAEALRGSLRQDPDVILVGEMRDLETMETALVAAETGHLVLSTLHTLDAQETLTRIISAFPPYQQKSIRIQLAGLLKAVVSQRLMKSAKGTTRVPAVEVLISTPLIRDYILERRKNRTNPRCHFRRNFAIRNAGFRPITFLSLSIRSDHARRSPARLDQPGRISSASRRNPKHRVNGKRRNGTRKQCRQGQRFVFENLIHKFYVNFFISA